MIDIQFQAHSGTQYHLSVDYIYHESPATYDCADESELVMEIVLIDPDPCGADAMEIFNEWHEGQRLYEHAADEAMGDYKEMKYD